jgi:hypothetical protein
MFANDVTAEEVSARLIFSDDNATESLRLVMVVCYELCIYYLVTATMNCLVCESRIVTVVFYALLFVLLQRVVAGTYNECLLRASTQILLVFL